MRNNTRCPVCSKVLQVPDGSGGKEIPCDGCGTTCRFREQEDGSFLLSPTGSAASPASPQASLPCETCGEPITAGDDFCQGCGSRVSEDTARQLVKKQKTAELQKGIRTWRKARTRRTHQKSIARAAFWILVLAVLYLVFGTVVWLVDLSNARIAEVELAEYYTDDEVVPVSEDGETCTVGELKNRIRAEVTLTLTSNYILGVILVGLFFWARKRPFPAILTAFCVFLVVNVLAAAVNPAALFQGLLIKVLSLVALIGGLRAALAERAEREARPPGNPRTAGQR